MMAENKNKVSKLAITCVDNFLFGKAPHPVSCGRNVEIGYGMVIPEINFTLPRVSINKDNWPEIRRQYTEMIENVCKRAVELEAPALLVEFETLPPMTVKPQWGAEITSLLADTLQTYYNKFGLKNALRLTPNDTRDHQRPPMMRRGKYLEGMIEMFHLAGEAGADLLAIESTGGKEICDEAIMNGDFRTVIFALSVLAARDMEFLWKEIVAACTKSNIIPSSDTACGFSNTAMVLAEKKFIPKVFAALIRVAAVPRSLIAFRMGAVGPSKDCAYEGPYMKAICGIPISMEGRTAACAHLSPVGNITQAVCDCWSNESVQNLRLLSTNAPTVCLEQLVYDCRLMNTVLSHSDDDARKLRDWLVQSDAALDPQAFVLRPDVVLRISNEIIKENTPYRQTRRAVAVTIDEIKRAYDTEELKIPPQEVQWLNMLGEQVVALPDSEDQLFEELSASFVPEKFLKEEYGF